MFHSFSRLRPWPALLSLGLALAVVSGCAILPGGLSKGLHPAARPGAADGSGDGVAGPVDGGASPATGVTAGPNTSATVAGIRNPAVSLTPVLEPTPLPPGVVLVPSEIATSAPGADTPVLPTGTDLVVPSGVAVAANGDVYVADRSRQQVLRYAANGTASVFAGTGVQAYAADDVTALNAPLSSPHAVRFDGAGNLFVVELSPALRGRDLLEDTGQSDNLCIASDAPLCRVRRIGKDGKASTVYSVTRQLILDLVVTPDGVLYMAQWDPCGGKGSVVTVKPGQSPPAVVVGAERGYSTIDSLCYDQDRNLYATADSALLEYTADSIARVQLPPGIHMPAGPTDAAVITIHGGGEIFLCERSPARILRWTPFIGYVDIVAGAGSTVLGGSGAADSLSQPTFPTVAPDGSLYFIDAGHKRLQHLTRAQLAQAVPL